MVLLRPFTLLALVGLGLSSSVVSTAQAVDRPPLYYRDPTGAPQWSATPKKDASGRDYVPVYDEDDTSSQSPKPKAAAADPTRKILYYRNPMGLPDTSPVPKKDPMGMNHIPVYEGDDTDDGTIKLSPGKIQRAGVKSELVQRRPVLVSVKAPGVIQLDERRVSVIAMRSESFVRKVEDVTTGTRVKAGQPLMEIYSAAIAAAAADYLSTIASKTTAGNETFGRGSRQRLINLNVPEAAIAALEQTRIAPVTVQWTAPRDGVVLERSAIEGMRANVGDVLFRIADVSAVWAVVDVAERDLGSIAVGQAVRIRARAFANRIFAGAVKVIYPQVSRETRAVRVRIELDNPDLALLPDMYVDAEIDIADPGPVLTVPNSTILDTGTRQVVLVDKGDGRFEPRAVKLGRRGDGMTEITEGLQDGEAVVTSANFLIDAESNLRAALSGFAEAAKSAATDGRSDAGARP
ncbi:efflux RND transporter periplasmic adaptor subunit [Rhodopseudomonas pseudopalustris]|uniref:Membrane fusion protein, Cu(I)/Ag(I) efflux system n=1 Tax=Rhodopseudomonas pseudopalustris TaxID=1513892 RepID=A0A1H8T2E3_9BRAD|nr:efflux RND transporter periplasmic adaptor subunit [Rhodopseudomonas pseudopalustris]SEO85229.1 membrane fusion protein, Cu(I)/Ag(I) efflux system [Rhodopseudomonas pseudopalustris]